MGRTLRRRGGVVSLGAMAVRAALVVDLGGGSDSLCSFARGREHGEGLGWDGKLREPFVSSIVKH
jgi:hypothetical protein